MSLERFVTTTKKFRSWLGRARRASSLARVFCCRRLPFGADGGASFPSLWQLDFWGSAFARRSRRTTQALLPCAEGHASIFLVSAPSHMEAQLSSIRALGDGDCGRPLREPTAWCTPYV